MTVKEWLKEFVTNLVVAVITNPRKPGDKI
jgi:hypothetical protein